MRTPGTSRVTRARTAPAPRSAAVSVVRPPPRRERRRPLGTPARRPNGGRRSGPSPAAASSSRASAASPRTSICGAAGAGVARAVASSRRGRISPHHDRSPPRSMRRAAGRSVATRATQRGTSVARWRRSAAARPRNGRSTSGSSAPPASSAACTMTASRARAAKRRSSSMVMPSVTVGPSPHPTVSGRPTIADARTSNRPASNGSPPVLPGRDEVPVSPGRDAGPGIVSRGTPRRAPRALPRGRGRR